MLTAGRAGAQGQPVTLDDFLARGIGLTAAERAAVSRGETVGVVLPTADERDVAVFAAVRVAVPRSFFVRRQAEYPAALQTPTRTQVHLFGTPAVDADVQTLPVTAGDLRELRDCRPNACNFKLPATDMRRLQTTFDWAGPDVGVRVAAYFRRRMVDYVNAYRRDGNAAMLEYDDAGRVRSSEALAALVNDSSYAYRFVPTLRQYVTDYPRDTLPGAMEVIFWSIDQLPHVRPVLRITQETVFSPPELPGVTIVADKQIYADHYFEAGLELLTAVDLPGAGVGQPANGTMLIAVRRYRFDQLPNGGLLNVRGRAVDGLRENAVADLARLKRNAEAAWRTPPTRVVPSSEP